MLGEMRQKAEQLPTGGDPRSIAVDLLWEMASGPLYQAWLELVIASRTEAYPRESIRAINSRLTETVEKTLRDLLVPVPSSMPNLELFPVMLFFMVEGDDRSRGA